MWAVINICSNVAVQDDNGKWVATATDAAHATTIVNDHNLLEKTTNQTTETTTIVKRPEVHWK